MRRRSADSPSLPAGELARAGRRPGAVVAAVGGVAAVVVLALTTVRPRPTIAGAIGLVVVAIGLAALHGAARARHLRPAAVTFWAFVVVWVGLAPLLQIRDQRLPWPDLPLDQHQVTAQVILLVAVISYGAGHSRRLRAPLPRRYRFDITVEKAVLATGLALLMAVVCLPQTGGLAVRFTSRDTLQRAIAQAGLTSGRDLALLGLLNTLPAAAAMVSLVLNLVCWRHRRYAHPRAMRILLGTTLIAVLLNLVYNNPLSANRFTTFSAMLACVLVLMPADRQPWRSLFPVGMLVGLLVLYPLADRFRGERSRGELRLGLDAYYTIDFDGFQQTINAVNHVQIHGHSWGHHLVSALLFWVPRSLWEGKAVAAGNAVAASRGYTFQNLSLPLWAEAYVEFSLAGVVVAFFCYGLAARRLDRALHRAPADLVATAAAILIACQIGLLRGPLGAQIPYVGAACGLLLLTAGTWHGRRWGLTVSPDPDAAPRGRR